jgi:hypothetical protein
MLRTIAPEPEMLSVSKVACSPNTGTVGEYMI